MADDGRGRSRASAFADRGRELQDCVRADFLPPPKTRTRLPTTVAAASWRGPLRVPAGRSSPPLLSRKTPAAELSLESRPPRTSIAAETRAAALSTDAVLSPPCARALDPEPRPLTRRKATNTTAARSSRSRRRRCAHEGCRRRARLARSTGGCCKPMSIAIAGKPQVKEGKKVLTPCGTHGINSGSRRASPWLRSPFSVRVPLAVGRRSRRRFWGRTRRRGRGR